MWHLLSKLILPRSQARQQKLDDVLLAGKQLAREEPLAEIVHVGAESTHGRLVEQGRDFFARPHVIAIPAAIAEVRG